MEVDPLKLADNIENGNCMDDEGRFLLNVWEDELIVKALRSYARPEAGAPSLPEPNEAMAKAGGDWYRATLHNMQSAEHNACVIWAAMAEAYESSLPQGERS